MLLHGVVFIEVTNTKNEVFRDQKKTFRITISRPVSLQIHPVMHTTHVYATMADAVEDTYFQVGASLPT